MNKYIISIDQSTQGTKALLFDHKARLLHRADKSHEQIISKEGYVSHDLNEIYRNVLYVIRQVVEEYGARPEEIVGMGISNQRETTAAWNRETGDPVCDAIVWQCARAESLCRAFADEEREYVRKNTGIPLSPYFPAAKMGWILENVREARELADAGKLCLGTIDSWLLFKLSRGMAFKTDYSNASRTQLLNLHSLKWDERVLNMFHIPMECLPTVCDSNELFAVTDFEGFLPRPVPVHTMLGDSHGALFGHGCLQEGMVKTTYGTGSSIMMNVGSDYVESNFGLVTSLAWGMDGKVTYVLEGNLNYTGAVITWLKEDLGIIQSAGETESLAMAANPEDRTYLVPAFSGLGAPYWNSNARAIICGMSRVTGKKELVKAALDAIVYQITDILKAMEKDARVKIENLCVDGGPTGNAYLMQFQSDMAEAFIRVPDAEELSGIGAAYMAGIALGVFTADEAFANLKYREYTVQMDDIRRQELYTGWVEAVKRLGS